MILRPTDCARLPAAQVVAYARLLTRGEVRAADFVPAEAQTQLHERVGGLVDTSTTSDETDSRHA
jgi:hypothetical protein